MKNLKLIFNIVFLIAGIWLVRLYIKSEREVEKSDENYDVSFAEDNKKLDDQVNSVLSDGVIIDTIKNSDGMSDLEINGRKLELGKAVYEKVFNGVEITISDGYYTVFVKLNDLAAGEYDMSDNGNMLKIYDNDEFITYTDGVVVIDNVSGGMISGSFNAGNVKGKIIKAMPVSEQKDDKEQIVNSNYLKIKADGTINRGTVISIFKYDKNSVYVQLNLPDGKENISADVKDIVVTPTSVTLTMDDDDIDVVIIDKLNKQITLQYKNGDSMVLL